MEDGCFGEGAECSDRPVQPCHRRLAVRGNESNVSWKPDREDGDTPVLIEVENRKPGKFKS